MPSGADFLFGDDFAAYGSFQVNSGEDTLDGGSGNDELWGFDGNDIHQRRCRGRVTQPRPFCGTRRWQLSAQ